MSRRRQRRPSGRHDQVWVGWLARLGVGERQGVCGIPGFVLGCFRCFLICLSLVLYGFVVVGGDFWLVLQKASSWN